MLTPSGWGVGGHAQRAVSSAAHRKEAQYGEWNP
jgi:hypothetical protein